MKRYFWKFAAVLAAFTLAVIVAGCGGGNGGSVNQTPEADHYTFSNMNQTAGSVTDVIITKKDGKSPGAVNNIRYDGGTTIPQEEGDYAVTFDVAAAAGWNPASGLSAGTLIVGDPLKQTPAAADYNFSNMSQTAGSVTAVTIEAKSGKSPGAVSNIRYDGSITIPQEEGDYAVTFDVAAAEGWNAASNLSAGNLAVTTNEDEVIVVGDFVGTLLNDSAVKALPDIGDVKYRNPVEDYGNWTPGWVPYEVLERLNLWAGDDTIFWRTTYYGKPGIIVMGRPPRTETHHRRVGLPQSAVQGGFMAGDVVTFSAILGFRDFDMQFEPLLIRFGHTTYPHGTHWYDFTDLVSEKYQWNQSDEEHLIEFTVTLDEQTVAQLNTPDARIQLMFYCTEITNHRVRTLPITVHEFKVLRNLSTAKDVTRNLPKPPVQRPDTGSKIFDLRTNSVIQNLPAGAEIDHDNPKILADVGILPMYSTAKVIKPADNNNDTALSMAWYKKNIDGNKSSDMRFSQLSLRVLVDHFPDITVDADTPIIFYNQPGNKIYRNQYSRMKLGDQYSVKGKIVGLPASFTAFEVLLSTCPSYGWNTNMDLVLDRVTINPGGSGEFNLSGVLDQNIAEVIAVDGNPSPRKLLDYTQVPHGSQGAYTDTIFYRLALQFDGGVQVRVYSTDEWSPLRSQIEILVTDFTVVRPGY